MVVGPSAPRPSVLVLTVHASTEADCILRNSITPALFNFYNLTVSRDVCEVSAGYGDFGEDLKRWHVGALVAVARSALA